MRKHLLTIGAFVCLVFGAQAQDTLFNGSNFTGGFENMSLINADSDTLGWTVFDLTGAGTAIDAQGEVLGSYSWTSQLGALTPDNWVITPALDLSNYSASTLTFGRKPMDASYAAENYSVYVVQAADQNALATALASATAALTETISDTNFVTKTVDLSSFAGQANVYVAFRHHNCTDQFLLVIDDIIVSATSGGGLTKEDIKVSTYPNPANSELNISLNENMSTVSILSAEGKVISTQSVNGNNANVNVSELNSGVYFYSIVTENGAKITNTFVKK